MELIQLQNKQDPRLREDELENYCKHCDEFTRVKYKWRLSVWGIVGMIVLFYFTVILAPLGLLVRQRAAACDKCRRYYQLWYEWIEGR